MGEDGAQTALCDAEEHAEEFEEEEEDGVAWDLLSDARRCLRRHVLNATDLMHVRHRRG